MLTLGQSHFANSAPILTNTSSYHSHYLQCKASISGILPKQYLTSFYFIGNITNEGSIGAMFYPLTNITNNISNRIYWPPEQWLEKLCFAVVRCLILFSLNTICFVNNFLNWVLQVLRHCLFLLATKLVNWRILKNNSEKISLWPRVDYPLMLREAQYFKVRSIQGKFSNFYT